MVQQVVLGAPERALGESAHVVLEHGVRDERVADLLDLLRSAENGGALEEERGKDDRIGYWVSVENYAAIELN